MEETPQAVLAGLIRGDNPSAHPTLVSRKFCRLTVPSQATCPITPCILDSTVALNALILNL